MERLTYYSMRGSENDGWYLKPGVAWEEAREKLAEYEDIGTVEELRQALFFKKYFMELYGEGLEVANWHLGGDLEPMDNFIDEALIWKEGKDGVKNE